MTLSHPLLGFDCRKLSNSNGKEKRKTKEKGKVALKARQTVVVKNLSPLGVSMRVYL
jgi:hypothetical protein